jgi:outer membrane lipoprotein LolB
VSRGASVHLAVWLALAVSVGGCAQLSVLTGARPETGAATSFEMLGRVYVRFGQRGFSGTLRWVHGMPSDEIWLGGPLGQTAAHILRDASGATLTTADQQTYRSFSVEGLTEKGLGWTLPVADLSYYVLGQAPPPALAGAERDAEGRLTQAQHEGWLVRWIAPPAGESRPGRLEMRKGDVEIRLVIDRLDRQP